MSKKSRRRNKKILGALLLGGLGLAARNKRNAAIDSGIRSAEDDKGSDMMEFKEKIVPKPKPDVNPIPRLKVDSIGTVYKNGVDKGVGNKNTKFRNTNKNLGDGAGIYQGGKKVSGLNQKSINVLSDGSIQSGGATYPNKAAYSAAMKAERAAKRAERNNFVPDYSMMSGLGQNDFAAKDGGRAKMKKGGRVGCGAAKRGFGRALKKGRK
jgi:hypothetical protein